MSESEHTTSTSLVSVKFHDQEVDCWQDELTQDICVAMRRLVSNLGLNWSGQRVRITKSPIFQPFVRRRDIYTPKGVQEIIGLHLDALPTWLTSINPLKVREDLRDTIIQYQKECVQVLRDYWFTGQAIHPAALPQKSHDVLYREALRILDQYQDLGRRLNTHEDVTNAVAVKAILDQTGIDLHALIAPEAQIRLVIQPPKLWMKPEDLASYLDIPGGKEGANTMLCRWQWQTWCAGCHFEPTEEGMAFCRYSSLVRDYAGLRADLEWDARAVALSMAYRRQRTDDPFWSPYDAS